MHQIVTSLSESFMIKKKKANKGKSETKTYGQLVKET